jgi:hypothetical protein
MTLRRFAIVGAALLAVATFPSVVAAEAALRLYARIAVLHPNAGDTIEFEAGYIRHLDWHREAKDPWTWYGWTVWAGERQRWFVYATFGHTAAELDHSVNPAEDERDNVANVVPHAEFAGNALYEFLPALSRGSGEPTPTMRLEMMTVELAPGAAKAFEAALAAHQGALEGETLWYRMIAGGSSPRYVRMRPRDSLAAIIEDWSRQALPDKVNAAVARTTVEILTLRPTMCYGLLPNHA